MIRNSLKLTKLSQSKQTLNYLKLSRPLYQTGIRTFSSTLSKFNEAKEAKTYDFKTETHQLLDIVANSLYSEKEVFVRELVSNAADALEKLRHHQLVDLSNCSVEAGKDLEINIKLSAEDKTFIIQDNGIGMTEEQLHENLGTIARSGSKAFVKKLNEGGSSSTEAKDKIIGQFGVGFYSAFMVGHTLKVYTKSCIPGSKGYVWTSTGKGAYDVAEVDDVEVGTKIVIELKDLDFSNDLKIKEIIQKYSNFVGFPIKLNGEVVNTVEPIWTKSANEITEEDHKAFFNQLTSSYNSPRYNLIYKADAPLSIRSVLYIPETSPEWLGMATSQTGINLYSRKVMIQAKSPHLLPNWLRFISGVVDSEDIPLNLSREILQNGALIQKLKSVLTNRVVKWLIEEERRDPEKFELFYTQFHMYIKEGVVTDDAHRDNLMKLLRFNSSALDRTKKTTFQSYLDRKKPDQKSIYYLCRTFDNVEDNPYYEPFKAAGVEVMVLTEPIDEMLIQQLENFKDTPLVNIESKKASEEIQELSPTQLSGDRLSDEDGQVLSDWIREEYGSKLSLRTIQVSKRQSSHPALVVGHDAQNSIYFQQLMKQSLPPGETLPLSPVTLEINTSHALIKGLFELKQTNPQIAKDLAYQICCNARIAAGVMEDTKPLLTSLNNLLTDLVKLKLEGNKKD